MSRTISRKPLGLAQLAYYPSKVQVYTMGDDCWRHLESNDVIDSCLWAWEHAAAVRSVRALAVWNDDEILIQTTNEMNVNMHGELVPYNHKKQEFKTSINLQISGNSHGFVYEESLVSINSACGNLGVSRAPVDPSYKNFADNSRNKD
ncbi:role in phospholipid translocation across the plasma membrane [Corchorus olitorius]|uniref:Role in phospholipid translocation across the plasma membrane n=1 Tax=Corchorus olitorius TaxID=93759 RepID=A0A1R3KK28_9ROSI|nr:role in phospholipid translocation across the plasma membrane [Corchorus olitorius]